LAAAIATAAAVVEQVLGKAARSFEPCAVDERAAVACFGNKARTLQMCKMKRQRGRRQAKRFGDGTGGKAFGPGFHQKPKRRKAVLLRQGGQGSDRGRRIDWRVRHEIIISIFLEISKYF
jgi:hypothetical protein